MVLAAVRIQTSVTPTSSESAPVSASGATFAWRFEALYIWNRSRNTIDEGFTTSDNIIDFRVKRVW